MESATGPLNIPLGSLHSRQIAAYLPCRNQIFLRGPLPQNFCPKIQVDFPLDNEYDFQLIPKNPRYGITIGELVDRVMDIYNHIYNQPAPSGQLPRIDNLSNNDYGIYTHDLDELVLVEAEYSPADGTIYLLVEAVR